MMKEAKKTKDSLDQRIAGRDRRTLNAK